MSVYIYICLYNFFPPADNSSKNRIRPVQQLNLGCWLQWPDSHKDVQHLFLLIGLLQCLQLLFIQPMIANMDLLFWIYEWIMGWWKMPYWQYWKLMRTVFPQARHKQHRLQPCRHFLAKPKTSLWCLKGFFCGDVFPHCSSSRLHGLTPVETTRVFFHCTVVTQMIFSHYHQGLRSSSSAGEFDNQMKKKEKLTK